MIHCFDFYFLRPCTMVMSLGTVENEEEFIFVCSNVHIFCFDWMGSSSEFPISEQTIITDDYQCLV